MDTCRTCNEPVNRNYCPNCGQPAHLKRIDKRYVIGEIANIFYVEKGFIYTVKKMTVSPGESVRQYLSEDRSRYMKPVTYLIVTSLVYTIVSHVFHLDARDFYRQQPDMEFPTVNLFINWMIDYNGYSSIAAGLFVGFWVKLFFRKSGYNLFEIFVLLCYVLGTPGLIFSAIVVVQSLTNTNLLYLSFAIGMVYRTWATGQFFDRTKASSYIKSFAAYVLGFVIIGFSLASVALLIDIMAKR